ncbi:response regulator [Candidatus Nitrospira bockiana]
MAATQYYLSYRDHALRVETTTDPIRALRLMLGNDYDVIVTDLRLNGLDGMDLVEACAATKPDTPVIVVSGYGDLALEREAAAAGAYAFLHKPIDPDVFYSVVKRAALRAQLRRKPERILREDSRWMSYAMEQIRARLSEVDGRLRQAVEEAGRSRRIS